MEHAGARRIGHHDEACRIERRADAEHPQGSEPVGHRAREGLTQAPEQILQGDRKSEHVAAPAMFERYGNLKKAGGGTWPEGDQRDQAPGEDDEFGRDAACRDGHGGSFEMAGTLAQGSGTAKRVCVITPMPPWNAAGPTRAPLSEREPEKVPEPRPDPRISLPARPRRANGARALSCLPKVVLRAAPLWTAFFIRARALPVPRPAAYHEEWLR